VPEKVAETTTTIGIELYSVKLGERNRRQKRQPSILGM
jgi:hypothetical protein